MKACVDVIQKDLQKNFELALRHMRERITPRTPVKDVMTRNVIAVKRTVDLHKAARILSDHKINGLLVVDAENRVIGVISGADSFPRRHGSGTHISGHFA